ncbi:hypothetical protein M405DRAFT_828129 [Rhizopogon salebrosus TDB-379]|nr:hypothetical protein M405DRAFT_828129 [Rhizopogon salebrosus TDB-379]
MHTFSATPLWKVFVDPGQSDGTAVTVAQLTWDSILEAITRYTSRSVLGLKVLSLDNCAVDNLVLIDPMSWSLLAQDRRFQRGGILQPIYRDERQPPSRTNPPGSPSSVTPDSSSPGFGSPHQATPPRPESSATLTSPPLASSDDTEIAVLEVRVDCLNRELRATREKILELKLERLRANVRVARALLALVESY